MESFSVIDIVPKIPKKRWMLYSLFVIFLSIFVYASAFVSPKKIWWFAFVSYLIPLLLIFHVIMVLIWFFRKKKAMLVHILLLIIGFPFIQASISVSFPDWEKKDGNTFSVLSYNVRVFNVYDHLNNKFNESKEIIQWVKSQNSDIQCFQEYYNNPKNKIFDVTNDYKKLNYHTFVHTVYRNRINAEFGLAIFSKFPILNKGEVPFKEKKRFNSAIYADILLLKDTIRIINMHLQSIYLDENQLLDDKTNEKEVKGVIEKLKKGFLSRAEQIEDLQQFIRKTKYPTILCGDLNDMPYSFAYQSLNNVLENTFEAEGNGLGFTYNGRLFFLRIDHQFFSKRFDPLSFKVHREAKNSDHFPISVVYELEKD
jgi:endonuclease/exonuclease/phosphatase family metal-dependent hydrolase